MVGVCHGRCVPCAPHTHQVGVGLVCVPSVCADDVQPPYLPWYTPTMARVCAWCVCLGLIPAGPLVCVWQVCVAGVCVAGMHIPQVHLHAYHRM